MSVSAYSLRSSLVTTLTRFRRPDVPVMVALRNTAAVVLPLAAGFASGHALAGLGMGVGALNVMFADQPGPYLQRLKLIATVTVAGALSALVGFMAASHPDLFLPALALWGFAGGMLVLFGPRMTRVGMTSMILLIVSTTATLPWPQAIGASGLILAGGALQALFSIAAWPLRRYRPERFALASVYRDLARQARQQLPPDEAPPVSDTLTFLQQTLLGRPQSRSRAMEAFHTLLALTERMRLELMALNETVTVHTRHDRFRQAAGRTLDDIALALERAEPPRRATRSLEALHAVDEDLATDINDDGTLRHAHALIGQIAAAVRNANWAGSRGEIRAVKADTALPRALRNIAPMAALRANLTFSSVAFRHAVRMSALLLVAGVVSQHIGIGHGYWLPMTAAIVLRPDFGATLNFGLLRMLGTIAGLLLTTTLLLLTPQSLWAHLALMAVLCFGFRYLASAHYGIAVASLTGTVVILLSFEGIASNAAATERVIHTVLGCMLALLGYLAWPTWERGRVRQALATMLESYAGYLQTLTGPDTGNARWEARTTARAARSNAQASLERLRAEPATPTETIEMATALFTAANRLVRTAMAWEALHDDYDELPCVEAMAVFTETARTHLQELAGALREQRSPIELPSLRERQKSLIAGLDDSRDPTLSRQLNTLSDRLTDNVDTLAHILERVHSHAPAPARHLRRRRRARE